MAEKFFKSLDRAGILRRMARAGADVGEAEPLEELADRALVIGDPEALEDDALQVDPTPAHHAVHGPVRTGFDELRNLKTLLLREARLATFGPVVQKTVGAVFVKAVNPVAQRLAVLPPIRAASVRFMPSRTAASDRSRRLWLAFFVAAASLRSSAAE